jgi:hypothetical protein
MADRVLTLAEAFDGGDWKVNLPKRDKVIMLPVPFDAPQVEIVRLEQR